MSPDGYLMQIFRIVFMGQPGGLANKIIVRQAANASGCGRATRYSYTYRVIANSPSSLHFAAYPLHFAKDPQQVSAENFLNVFRA